MPASEAYLDAPADLVRTSFAGYTGDVCGVLYEQGVALSGMRRPVAERCCGNFGAPFVIVGPWADAPVAPTKKARK